MEQLGQKLAVQMLKEPLALAFSEFASHKTLSQEALDRLFAYVQERADHSSFLTGASDAGEVAYKFTDLLKEFTGIALLLYMANVEDKRALNLVKILEIYPLWEEFQLAQALSTLLRMLVKKEGCPLSPVLTGSGAAIADTSGQLSWGGVPHPMLHAELGILWGLIGSLGGQAECLTASLSAGRWLCNTLDYHAKPLEGLFRQRLVSSTSALFMSYALLFEMLLRISSEGQFGPLAEKAWGYCHEVSAKPISEPFYAAVALWLEGKKRHEIRTDHLGLTPIILDSSFALAGIRHPEKTFVCTLSGGSSGFGVLKQTHGAEIIGFGPQHLPLERNSGFGFEERMSSREPHVVSFTERFSIEGCVRLIYPESRPVEELSPTWVLDNHKVFPMWIQALIEGDLSGVDLKLKMLGREEELQQALVFYCRADKLMIGGRVIEKEIGKEEKINAQTVGLLGGHFSDKKEEDLKEKRPLSISTVDEETMIEILHLDAQKDPWGADFCLAYPLLKPFKTYHWKLSS